MAANNNIDDTTKYQNYKSTCRGFYYDTQRDNPLTSVTLHPNAELKGKEWKPIGDGEDKDEEEYRIRPLCKSIMSEDFVVGIANNWTDFTGGTGIEDLWNAVKPFAPYTKYLEDNWDTLVKNGEEALNDSDIANSKFANSLQDMAKSAKPYIDKATNYLNRSLVVQGTRFKYYSGTGTSFSNLNMKFTVFADCLDGVFWTVDDQLQELYPYLMGHYVDWDEKNHENSVNQFVGWQKPPGGFEADVKNINNIQKGTLKLKFGSFYSLSNLVVRDAQLNFSKQMVKNPETAGEISPLYCDVNITLEAATKYTDVALKRFVSGDCMSKERNEIKKILNNSLTQTKSDIKSLIDGIKKP